MAELTDILDAVLRDTCFDAGPHGTFSAGQVRSLHSGGDPYVEMMVYGAKAIVPEGLLAVLAGRLGQELQAYIDPESQRMGTGLVSLMGGAVDSAEPTVTEFVETLVRASAFLGPSRAVQILRGWIAGEPYRYRMKMLLTGVRCEQPLNPQREDPSSIRMRKDGATS